MKYKIGAAAVVLVFLFILGAGLLTTSMSSRQFAVIGGTDRGTLTELRGDKYYAYPRDGSPGTSFVSKYAIKLGQATYLETWGNTCPPAAASGEWVLVGKGYYNNVQVPIKCYGDGVTFLRPSYDELRTAGLPLPARYPNDYKVSMKAEMTYELRGVPKPLDVQLLEVEAPEEVTLGQTFSVIATGQVLNQNCAGCIAEVTATIDGKRYQDAFSILSFTQPQEQDPCGRAKGEASGIRFNAGAGDFVRWTMWFTPNAELEGVWTFPVSVYDKCGGVLLDRKTFSINIRKGEEPTAIVQQPITPATPVISVPEQELIDDPVEPVVTTTPGSNDAEQIPDPGAELPPEQGGEEQQQNIFGRFWIWLKALFSTR